MDDISFDFDASKLVGNIMKVQMSFDKMWESAESSTGIEQFKKTQDEIKNTDKATGGLINKFKNLFGIKKQKIFDGDTGTEEFKKTRDEVQKTGKSVSDFGKSGNLSLISLVKGAALVGGAFFAIKGILSAFPEFGDTLFSFGEIIKYNILGPIRDELIPILNSILSWASSNEKLFTRIGVGIATAFRIGIQVVKSFFSIVQTLFKSIFGRISELTGATIGGVENALNLAATKIAATLNFIMIVAEPIFKAIGNLIGNLIVGFKEFFSGAADGIGDLSESTENITKLFKVLFGWLTKTKDESNEISGIWSGIGKVVGTVVKLIIKALDLLVGFGFATAELFNSEQKRNKANMQILSERQKMEQGIGEYAFLNKRKKQRESLISNSTTTNNTERVQLSPVNNMQNKSVENKMNANANVYVTQNIYEGGADKANEIVEKTNSSLKTGILKMFGDTLEATGL